MQAAWVSGLSTSGLYSSIGIFDSGVGGLSVLREVVRRLPRYDVLYLADSAHVPYGARKMEEIQALSRAITQFLVDRAQR